MILPNKQPKQHVILVDEQDNPVGEMEKLAAHQQGICHRAFSVFIFRKQYHWQCLLQQRHFDKYHCGGLWTNTCCSHPFPQEETLQGASRRLREEMGISVPLQYVDKFHYIANCNNNLIENEIDHVFIGVANQDLIVTPNLTEVAQYKWMPVNDLLQELQQCQHLYTPWLAQALQIALTALPEYK